MYPKMEIREDGDQGDWKLPQSPGNLEPGAPAFPQQRRLDSHPNISLTTSPAQCGANVLSSLTGVQGRALDFCGPMAWCRNLEVS